jgi:hypothetical protein
MQAPRSPTSKPPATSCNASDLARCFQNAFQAVAEKHKVKFIPELDIHI